MPDYLTTFGADSQDLEFTLRFGHMQNPAFKAIFRKQKLKPLGPFHQTQPV